MLNMVSHTYWQNPVTTLTGYCDEGPIIRVSPWEVHVQDVEFLDDIYAPSYRRREKYAFQTETLKVPMSVGGSMNHELHRKRREALNPFFSKRSVVALGFMISSKVDLLRASLERHVNDGTPVNLSDIYYAFAHEEVSKISRVNSRLSKEQCRFSIQLRTG